MRDISSGPPVSIGVPVYNEERRLPGALDSLLAQSYTNFELIISDNASNDRTEEIARQYAASDDRVKYLRHQTNVGSFENFNRVFRASRGKYFMWAAADDRWDPRFIESCLIPLEEDDTVVLAYPQVVQIDAQGNKTGLMIGRFDSRDYETGLLRFVLSVLGCVRSNSIYGLIRRSALARTQLYRKTLGGGHICLSELSIIGKFAFVPDPLFFRRVDQHEASRRRVRRWLDSINPKDAGHRVWLPYGRMMWQYMDVAIRAPVGLAGKLAMAAAVCVAIPWRYRARLLRLWS